MIGVLGGSDWSKELNIIAEPLDCTEKNCAKLWQNKHSMWPFLKIMLRRRIGHFHRSLVLRAVRKGRSQFKIWESFLWIKNDTGMIWGIGSLSALSSSHPPRKIFWLKRMSPHSQESRDVKLKMGSKSTKLFWSLLFYGKIPNTLCIKFTTHPFFLSFFVLI